MTNHTFPTLADVLAAHKTIAPYLPPTPLHHYPMLDQLLDAEVYVKHENYQPIGAFKVRGGINFMAHLDPATAKRGVVTASTGNHGQSIAYAAQVFGIKAAIVVPEGANPVKVEAMRAYGADVIFHLAAAVGVRLIMEEPSRSILTNINGTENVLKAALSS